MSSLRAIVDPLLERYDCSDVLHVGAHEAQELEWYEEVGLRPVWVEPQPKLAKALRDRGLNVIEAAVGTNVGKGTLHITPWTQRSSLLVPRAWRTKSQIAVDVMSLDMIADYRFDVLVVDVQGSELDVLQSGDLSNFDVIVVECRAPGHYAGQANAADVLAHLEESGFRKHAEVSHGPNGVFDLVAVKA